MGLNRAVKFKLKNIMTIVRRKHKGEIKKITSLQMEVEVARFFNPRVNIIVPNVFWSMFKYECDLVVLTPANRCYEIEIKVCKYDLRKDKDKKHNHDDPKFKRLYFAIPWYLKDEIEHIPEQAGILIINPDYYDSNFDFSCELFREPRNKSKYIFSQKERLYLLELLGMRIWGLKNRLNKVLK